MTSTVHAESAGRAILSRFLERTPESRALMRRASGAMPGGSTRTYSHHDPYPLVLERGSGCSVWDVDGNSYIDFSFNNWSLIHGHAYAPVIRAVKEACERGSAWPGASRAQIDFAEGLCKRVPTFERIRFCNTGTEAAMLAIKLARDATGRQLILKAWGGYHGSSADLEAGLFGARELEGRTLLATFGDLEGFESQLRIRGDEIAAVILEPVMCTGVMMLPPPGFLVGVASAAAKAGAVFILDDCQTFRIAAAGAQEAYDLKPDATILGKFIGGGLPVGVVGGSAWLLERLNPLTDGCLYHGGTFNGNPLGCTAGAATLTGLTADRIVEMNQLAQFFEAGIMRTAEDVGVPVSTVRAGSALGVYLTPSLPAPGESYDWTADNLFRVACLNNGVFLGTSNDLALATVTTRDVIVEALDAMAAALAEIGPLCRAI